MSVLVTGGTGFTGINIVKALAEHGDEVVALDLQEPDDLTKRYVQPWADRVTFVKADLRYKSEIERATKGRGITKIAHAARDTSGGPNEERDRIDAIVDLNVVTTANVLDLARTIKVERFVFQSSVNVYGKIQPKTPGEILKEDSSTIYPVALESSTNYAGEMLTRVYGELNGFQAISVRQGSTYGPMERNSPYRNSLSTLYEWTGNVVRGEPIRVPKDRSLSRQYTHASDIGNAVRTVVDAPNPSYDVYNIGAEGLITLDEAIKALQELRPSLKVVMDPEKTFTRFRPRGVYGIMDVSRLRQDLGFKAEFDVKSGLADFIKWREEFSFGHIQEGV